MRRECILAFICASAFGQEFEAASVKPSALVAPFSLVDGGPGMFDPEHFTAKFVELRDALCMAYAVADCQQQIVGPGWIDSEKYDIAANVPPGATKEQFQKMLQNLLTEWFQLVLRHETRMLPVYELVATKNGPKLKESAGTGPAAGVITTDATGIDVHWTMRRQTTGDLARELGSFRSARQVIDKTGLSGKYDFELHYHFQHFETPFPNDATESSMQDALEQQLGLKLVDAKAPFDCVVIEGGEKVPLAN